MELINKKNNNIIFQYLSDRYSYMLTFQINILHKNDIWSVYKIGCIVVDVSELFQFHHRWFPLFTSHVVSLKHGVCSRPKEVKEYNISHKKTKIRRKKTKNNLCRTCLLYVPASLIVLTAPVLYCDPLEWGPHPWPLD